MPILRLRALAHDYSRGAENSSQYTSSVKKTTIQERPAYVVESVDNVLRLLQLLRDSGSLRVTDAAAELDIALSTAHRLFSMLVYRGFATQDEQRRYVPGPAMDAPAITAP